MASHDVYVLVFDGFADWEPAHAIAELRRRGKHEIVAVGFDAARVTSMGGFHVSPDHALADVAIDRIGLLILPGGDMWESGRFAMEPLTALLRQLVANGTPVAAICGGTLALARAGLLNDRRHTSTVPGDLSVAGPAYVGGAHYASALAVTDRGVITASGLGSVDFAREVFAAMGTFSARDAALWFQMYKHGRLPAAT